MNEYKIWDTPIWFPSPMQKIRGSGDGNSQLFAPNFPEPFAWLATNDHAIDKLAQTPRSAAMAGHQVGELAVRLRHHSNVFHLSHVKKEPLLDELFHVGLNAAQHQQLGLVHRGGVLSVHVRLRRHVDVYRSSLQKKGTINQSIDQPTDQTINQSIEHSRFEFGQFWSPPRAAR